MSFSFPKSARLLHRRQFQRLARNHHSLLGQWIVIEKRHRSYTASPSSPSPYPTKLGITVTRRYGKAHDRNRFKRLVREAFRLCRHQIPVGLELNIRPRKDVSSLTPADLVQEFKKLLIEPSKEKM